MRIVATTTRAGRALKARPAARFSAGTLTRSGPDPLFPVKARVFRRVADRPFRVLRVLNAEQRELDKLMRRWSLHV